jgi:hypothetical protein
MCLREAVGLSIGVQVITSPAPVHAVLTFPGAVILAEGSRLLSAELDRPQLPDFPALAPSPANDYPCKSAQQRSQLPVW